MAVKKGVWLFGVLLVLLVVFSFYVVGLPVTGRFQTANVAPPTPTAFQIQDGAANWDGIDNNTHDITPNIRWDQGVDVNGNSITTHVCIAGNLASRGNFYAGDSSGCVFDTQVVGDGSLTITNIAGLIFLNPKTDPITYYYIALIPDDGTENGTGLNVTLQFIDDLPVVSAFLIDAAAVVDTHNQAPTLSWTVTDPDTSGGVDDWPADTLQHRIWVNDDSTLQLYYENLALASSSATVSPAIPWGPAGAEWANRTINVTMLANDGHFDGYNVSVTYTLYDFLPYVDEVKIVDSLPYGGACETAGNCLLTPVTHSRPDLFVELTAIDTDDDCSAANHDATIMLCLNSTADPVCDETNYDYGWVLDSVADIGSSQCRFTFTAPKTDTIEFYQLPGTYKFHLNLTSQAGERTPPSVDSDATWEYGTLPSVEYASLVELGGGSVTLGQWNPGTELNRMNNSGNAILTLQWNASNPTHITIPANVWTLVDGDFVIDDDLSYDGVPDGSITEVALINTPQRTFQPAGGLQICTNWDCDTGSDETLNTYYHINPPALPQGEYNTIITLTIS